MQMYRRFHAKFRQSEIVRRHRRVQSFGMSKGMVSMENYGEIFNIFFQPEVN